MQLYQVTFERVGYDIFSEENQKIGGFFVSVLASAPVIFPEDFPNKRAYLQKVKSKGKGWTRFSGYYRLRDESLSLIKNLGENTIFCAKDIIDIEECVDEYIKISMTDLNARLVLRFEKCYIVS